GHAVRAYDDEIDRGSRGKGNIAANEIGKREIHVRDTEPQGRLTALGAKRGLLFFGEVAVVIVVPELFGSSRRLVARIDLFRCGKALIQVAGVEQPLRHVRVKVETLRLTIRPMGSPNFDAFIPVEAEPAHRL